MKERNIHIKNILTGVRVDLRKETRKALELCTDSEIDSILKKSTNYSIMCLEMDRVFGKMIIFNRIKEDLIPNWEIKSGAMYELNLLKYQPGIRINKIDNLIGDNNDE